MPEMTTPRPADDVITTVPISPVQLRAALVEAEGWAEGGYSDQSRAYWAGMRDTLRVILGDTTTPPLVSGPDADVAALTILRPVPATPPVVEDAR